MKRVNLISAARRKSPDFGSRPALLQRAGIGRAIMALLLSLPLLAENVPSAQAAPIAVAGGPSTLCITFRSKPEDRPAFRAYLESRYATMLQGLEARKVLKHFQILYAPYVNAQTWDAMVVLQFTSFDATRTWQKIERHAPGGLSAKALALATPVDTISADLMWDGGRGPSRDAVYYAIPYEYRAADEYEKYVDAYVVPQFEGWLREGALAGYQILMNRYPVGPTWDSLVLLQYRDLQAFGHRGDVMEKVRVGLRKDPAWLELNKIKHSLRTESTNVIAEELRGD